MCSGVLLTCIRDPRANIVGRVRPEILKIAKSLSGRRVGDLLIILQRSSHIRHVNGRRKKYLKCDYLSDKTVFNRPIMVPIEFDVNEREIKMSSRE